MSWTVEYSTQAKQDLRNIFEYIAYNLLEPETAGRQVQRIMKEIRSLNDMPLRHRIYDEEPWQSQGLRFVPVNNYLVFYLPMEEKNSVSIVRIIYSGRDIRKQL
ncbi:MAG: type II toxin-antitoxin system RelE/ParE family toxin [Syntrophaceticus sp.]|jgi:toxin ParE1/3/4|nr:type II toxin-antitoxin system RelE/ParE family toxin [Syntrophaceticus sp.]HBG21997.1 type II toxin-antitoxin system RelE/ParE family toxin [Peptococcaceae bacterium]MDD3314928.1 type II toxin-antitoxin system RelE/ParE family toxin [Syntrophaceticus sp.]MDD4360393.1 type II toxin-antitoxin system RelE/ParE family toxin [Syntrophaceticus sp.]MDD4783416.1 type II toxin-antitoxin system RelE/ParE family toxin [Syntrophaceticus sp.]